MQNTVARSDIRSKQLGRKDDDTHANDGLWGVAIADKGAERTPVTVRKASNCRIHNSEAVSILVSL